MNLNLNSLTSDTFFYENFNVNKNKKTNSQVLKVHTEPQSETLTEYRRDRITHTFNTITTWISSVCAKTNKTYTLPTSFKTPLCSKIPCLASFTIYLQYFSASAQCTMHTKVYCWRNWPHNNHVHFLAKFLSVGRYLLCLNEWTIKGNKTCECILKHM